MAWFGRSAHVEEDLSAYVDGELGERARRAVERHLAVCEDCSTLLGELRDTKALLSELPRVEPRRSMVLGAEFATRREVQAPRRMSFAFAPAGVALTLLLALIVVDVTDSTGGTSGDAFNTAASRATGSTEALATKQGEAAGSGLAGDGASQGTAPTDPAGAVASRDDAETPTGGAGAALAQPAQDSTPQPEAAGVVPAPAQGNGAGGAADATAGGPEETTQLVEIDESHDRVGVSTIRALQVLAGLVFAASLLAVFLPRIVGRQER